MDLLESSSPWLLALMTLVAGVLVAAALAALVNIVARRLLRDPKGAGRLASIVFWVVAWIALLVAIGRLAEPDATEVGLTAAATRLLTSLPDLLIALLTLVLGWVVAVAVRSLLRQVLDRVRPGAADVLAPLAFWAILVLTVLIAAEQVGIQVGLLRNVLLILVGGVVLAAAIALGLGTRDLVAEVVAGRHVERVTVVGDLIEVGGHRGRVIALGHASVRLRTDAGEVEVPNGLLLSQPVLVVERVHPGPPPAPADA